MLNLLLNIAGDALDHLVVPSLNVHVLPHTSPAVVSTELIGALRFCGVLSLGVVGVSMVMLLVYLGACNALPNRINPCPVHDMEPMPRAVRWTYPEDLPPQHRHWFLLHVAQTRLVKGMYVASISQFVGARGTSGAKLMLLSCTAVAICQMQTAWMIWRIDRLVYDESEPMTRCLLMWAAAISLIFLGLAESALDWSTSVKVKKGAEEEATGNGMAHTGRRMPIYPTPDSPVDDPNDDDSDNDRPPPLKRLMSVYTEADEAAGKSTLRFMHMISAFAVVGFNFASQFMGEHTEGRVGSMITVSIGLISFIVFCLMQWLSGANDEIIPDALAPFRASALAYGACACARPICYCPPGFQHDPQLDPLLVKTCDSYNEYMGRSTKRSRIVCASWWFISVEVVSFVSLCSTAAIEALTLRTTQ